MAIIHLNAAETGVYDAIDAKLNTAFSDGIENNGYDELVAPLLGYTDLDQELKKLIKSTFMASVTATALSGTWTTPALYPPWTHYSTINYEGVAYYKEGMGIVHLRGLANPNSVVIPSDIFSLPAGFRPLNNRIFAASANDTFASVEVLDTGVVSVRAGPTGDLWYSLDGISFRAEQ